MVTFIFGLLLAVVAVVLWVLDTTYMHVPAKEMKRLARGGDDVAVLLYRPVAYGLSLRVLLGGGAVVVGALALVLFVQSMGVWLAVLVLLVVLALGGFVFVPSRELTKSSLWIAKRAAPGVAWVLER